ncbi:MAG: transporter [Lysobacterales bacterium 14-68-21]|jgi:outer membrane protein TolC|nr:MAG: transporter [Xanthomonadales bacterium 15-68-25]OZB65642.1 MAG: transporter [Xanthomonadales bacterium 14-68-21]
MARLPWLLVAALLAGCASYHARPLPDQAGARRVADLDAPAPPRWLPAHRFDPSDGLDVTEVATLAVANDPDLRTQRDALGIARAQAFAAGLLPDPQFDASMDFPRHGGAGLTNAFGLGLSADVTALLLRSSRVAAARQQARQVNLDLLWAEWQTVAQARLLFDQVQALRAKQTALDAEQTALAPLDQRVQAALRAGNLTHDQASAGLNALSDVRQQLADNALALHQADSDLHHLLGLAPEAPLDLVGPAYDTMPTTKQIDAALAALPQRRPDLLALQAGYAAQEASLRGAIRAQFPAITLGANTARDTSAVYTNGVSLGITLPLFDRNRGNIAIETATREQLRDDYRSRLLAAHGDIRHLQADLATLDARLATLTDHARSLDAGRSAAEGAFARGDLDWPTYLSLRGNALAADLALIDLHQQRGTDAIALEALLGNTALASNSDDRKAATP